MASVEFYRDRAGEWRWRLKARNGRILADSAEGYTRYRDCRHGYSRTCAALRGRVLVKLKPS